MPRKGKSASPGGRTHLSAEEEAERKAKQRELQLAAVAARQNGEVFINPEKKKRKPKEARRLAERKMKRKQESAAARRAVQKEVKKARAAAPDVVIVPIFWKGESQQMARVISACTDVEEALKDSGKKVLLDAGHKYTPGQKFAHWEHKGVTLRVEVGPREAERNCCTLTRTFQAGEVGHRETRVAIAAESLMKGLAKIAAMPAPVSAAAASSGGADEGEMGTIGGSAAERAAAAEAGGGGGGGLQFEPASTTTSSSKKRGGDDLEDDYADKAEDEEEEAPKKKKKKKDSVLALGGGFTAAVSKKAKTVTF